MISFQDTYISASRQPPISPFGHLLHVSLPYLVLPLPRCGLVTLVSTIVLFWLKTFVPDLKVKSCPSGLGTFAQLCIWNRSNRCVAHLKAAIALCLSVYFRFHFVFLELPPISHDNVSTMALQKFLDPCPSLRLGRVFTGPSLAVASKLTLFPQPQLTELPFSQLPPDRC